MTEEKKAKKSSTVSIDIKDVQTEFDVLKKHCEAHASWAKLTNADVMRFAIKEAARGISGVVNA